jgi:hypothetical protein
MWRLAKKIRSPAGTPPTQNGQRIKRRPKNYSWPDANIPNRILFDLKIRQAVGDVLTALAAVQVVEVSQCRGRITRAEVFFLANLS